MSISGTTALGVYFLGRKLLRKKLTPGYRYILLKLRIKLIHLSSPEVRSRELPLSGLLLMMQRYFFVMNRLGLWTQPHPQRLWGFLKN